MPTRRSLLAATALAGTAVLTAAPAATAPAPAAAGSRSSPALPDRDKRALIQEILAAFLPHAESYHRASDLDLAGTDYYLASGPGVTQPRGAGNLALAYATLLTEWPERAEFGGVAREVMLDHTIQSIRHEAVTNQLAGSGYPRWGGGTWQASLETYGWGWAAHLLWDELDPPTRELVERVVTAEADILITKPIPSGTGGNTAAEDNAWNTPTPALAAVMFPDHPNRPQWEESAIRLAVNASTTAADEQSSETIDGRPLSDWAESVNLQPDLTMENHAFFNPTYQQVAPLLIGDAAAIYAGAGHPVPEAFSWRVEQIWDQILGPLVSDDGDLIMPAGQDWTSRDYQHLAYLAVMATRFQRADASVAESRALELVARRQASHDGGAILGQADLGYETMLVKRLTVAYWNHRRFGPSPRPSREEYEAARAETAGVRELAHARVVEARQRYAFTSMSWDPARPMGLVVPAVGRHSDDPVFAAYLPGSLVGGVSGPVGPYSRELGEGYFSTGGTIGGRQFSLTSFPDGMAMLLDRGEGETFRFAFELIPGLTGDRTVHSAGGTGLGDLSGSWANVADRFGLAVAGGTGLRAVEVTAGNPYLRLDGSRGMVDYARDAPITSSSNQTPYPPELANDGDPATFWVSQTPATASAPQWLEIDLGEQREISRLVLTPRTNYGPRDIVWQVPDGDGGWRDVAVVAAGRSGPTGVTVDPVRTDRLRLLATSGHDPRNVQVAEVAAGPAEPAGGNRGAAVYPLVDAARTERLSARLRQPAVPDGWSALYAPAPDGTGRFAVARWAGPDRASLTLGTGRGAPLTRSTIMVDGTEGVAELALTVPGSTGETIRFFVDSDGVLVAGTTTEHHPTLTNEATRRARFTVTYVDIDGREHTARRALRTGQRAKLVGGRWGVRIIPG